MLEVSDVSKSFAGKLAVNKLSFDVEDGKILGIVGRNGAGKSVTFRMILNIINSDEGKILYNGEKITEKTLDKFGYLPEEGSLIQSYTVLELCEYYGALKLMEPIEIRENLIKWLERFNILEYMNMKIKKLSKGNKQKVQFIVANLHNPDFIILDEPFSGLDPVSVEEIKKFVIMLKNEGKTIVFSSHRMDHVEELCDKIIILNKGNTILKGDVDEIINSYKIDGKVGNNLNEIFIDAVGKLSEEE